MLFRFLLIAALVLGGRTLQAQMSQNERETFIQEYINLVKKYRTDAQPGPDSFILLLEKYAEDHNKEAFREQFKVLLNRNENEDLRLEPAYVTGQGRYLLAETFPGTVSGEYYNSSDYKIAWNELIDRYPKQELFPVFPIPKEAFTFLNHPVGVLTGNKYSARKHFKKGKKWLDIGRKYEAAAAMLDGLDVKPKKKIFKALRPIAGAAYEGEWVRMQQLLEKGQTRQAFEGFKHLALFREAMKRHRLLKGQKDPSPMIGELGEELAAEAFQRGEHLFDQGRYLEAELHYREANYYSRDHGNSREKIAEVYLHRGRELIQEARYEDAVNAHLIANQESEGHGQALSTAKEILYQLALYYESNGGPRIAFRHMNRLSKLHHHYKDVSEKLEEIKNKARFSLALGDLKMVRNYSLGASPLEEVVKNYMAKRLAVGSSPFFVIDQEPSDAVMHMELTDLFVHESKDINEERKHFQAFVMNVRYNYHKRSHTVSYNLRWNVVDADGGELLSGNTKIEKESKVEWAEILSFGKNDEDTQLPEWLQTLANNSGRETPPVARTILDGFRDHGSAITAQIHAELDRETGNIAPPETLNLALSPNL